MPAAEIRKRKTATDASDVDTVAEVKIVTTDEVAIIDSDEPKAKLALVRWVKGKQFQNQCEIGGYLHASQNSNSV